MNKLRLFEHEEFGSIRAIELNGDPWLVGKDVAKALGYQNPQEAIRTHVDEEDKGVSEFLTPGGKQNIPIINESGLYSLIMSSRLPAAKRFKRWVTAEVLPSIRRMGVYLLKEGAQACPPKAATVGEVAQLLRALRPIMKDNYQTPALIAQTAEMICAQFGISLPDGFVNRTPPHCYEGHFLPLSEL